MTTFLNRRTLTPILVLLPFVCVMTVSFVANRLHADERTARPARGTFDRAIVEHAEELFRNGAQIFRYDTFGDEHFWGDTLKLHQAIAGERFGGVGPGVSPAAALGAGLKVDVSMLPQSLIEGLRAGRVDLNDPANTLALLNLNAVVGV